MGFTLMNNAVRGTFDMQMLCVLWERLARIHLVWRLLVKIGMFMVTLFFVLNPHPVLFMKQLPRYADMESLIQTDFQGLETINRDIDAMLPPGADQKQELAVVQKYVYQHIRYTYDWDNWGNIDFWPTAEQVWERRQEDCDGQAVLAASILRSRGFSSATLVGNIQHIWVQLDQQDLMSPMAEQNISREKGKLVVRLPSLKVILGAMAIYITDFPTIRNLLLFWVILLLCYHPNTTFIHFLGTMSIGLLGFILLKDWAYDMMYNQLQGSNLSLICGGLFLGLSFVLPFFFTTNFMRRALGLSLCRAMEEQHQSAGPEK